MKSYSRKQWDKSRYMPQKMSYVAMDLTSEIKNTNANLADLANAFNDLSRNLNSGSYASTNSRIQTDIYDMKRDISVTAMNSLNDLIEVCNKIVNADQRLSTTMSGALASLNACTDEIGKLGAE